MSNTKQLPTSERQEPPRLLPFRWLAAIGLGGVALVLYLATLSRGAFPGLPAKSLVWQLQLDIRPLLLDSLWGYLVWALSYLPGGSVAFWVGVSSAVFGALCVVLLSLLTMRLRYSLHDQHDPAEVRREAQASLLAGVVAGLFLMGSIPFWILANRSLPGAFHLLLLLSATFLFSEYQRTGRVGFLYALGLLYGVGISEFATFWMFAPLTALLVVRAMLQRAEFSMRVLVRTGLCVLPGLLLYPLNAWWMFQAPGVSLRGFGSLWSVVWYTWRDQWHLIANAPQTSGFLLVMCLTVIPWGILFLMRSKKPAWRHSAWQVFLRVLVLAVAVATLYDAAVSPWHFFGMQYLMATPYVILAACAGYVAGEFWVMGQTREHRNAGIGQPLRRVMAGVGLLLPVAAVAALVLNQPVADGRFGSRLERLADETLDALDGRDVLLSDGIMDDMLRLRAWERGLPVHVVPLRNTDTQLYRQYLALTFNSERQQSLLQISFPAFMQEFIAADENLRRLASIDFTDPLREYGYLEPDRMLYRAEVTEQDIDLPALVERQKPFWAEMEEWAALNLADRNPAAGFRQYLLRLTSKVANNIGCMQVERGDKTGALATFQQARRLFPDNISALLNLLTIAQTEKLPEEAEYTALWDEFKARHMDSRVMWALSALYGYVYNAGYLVRHGMMWAVSGKPRLAEAELRRAAGRQGVNAAVKAFLGRAYLQGQDLQRSTEYYREAIQENPQDARSLLMLAEIALREEHYDEAEEWLQKVEAAGVPADRLRFERTALTCLRGDTDRAMQQLLDLVNKEKDNVRAWALLAMLTSDAPDPTLHQRAVKALKELQGTSTDVRLLLAELDINQQNWAAARDKLEQLTRTNPRNVRAWELLVEVDFRERKRDLADDHVRSLLTLSPQNYTGNLLLGSLQYARGQFSLAESSYRAALRVRRDPAALNDLAYLLLINKPAAWGEARALVEEALAAQPANKIVFLSTRSELNLREGRLDEAEDDLQQVLTAMPNQAAALLLAAELYAARAAELAAAGDAAGAKRQQAAALDLANSLKDRQNELSLEQQQHLYGLLDAKP
ncbi:MAG TPA: tetratricopeptide repeat protein [Kiritimatiellia bacterium]|nr:tetratricopeptide repeat protein [Kiritimatiellia bacterium]HQG74067.1 tetratricopeptide repeat protein [Kiritimatiellia bacterium]